MGLSSSYGGEDYRRVSIEKSAGMSHGMGHISRSEGSTVCDPFPVFDGSSTVGCDGAVVFEGSALERKYCLMSLVSRGDGSSTPE